MTLKFDLKKKIALIIAVSLVMTAVSYIIQKESRMTEYTGIERPSPGEGEQSKQLDVLGENGDLITSVQLLVGERELSQQEVYEYFEAAYDEVMSEMTGDNVSLEQVYTDLVLKSTAQNGIISLDWYSDDYETVDYDGKVYNSSFGEEDSRKVKLCLVMEYGDYTSEYEIYVTVVSPEYDEAEWMKVKAQNEIAAAESDSRQSQYVSLPEYIDGQKVSYELYEEQSSPYVFLVLGLAAAVVVLYSERKKKSEVEKMRKTELIYDYSEVVSKLMLLLGAGMTTRRAWQKITADYIEKKEMGRIGTRAVYEEMYEAECNIRAGISEAMAYEQFGRRCNTREYVKFASLLQTNIKKGTKELRRLLEQEAADAFEQRKNLARIKGEEATTKLLMPMILMLVIVMAIIMVPAMMTFNM